MNVPGIMLVVALQCPDGTPPPCGRARLVAATNSVAVLAFENRSRDSADVYLTEGFQDEVSNRLGQIPRLTVISPGVVRRLPRAAELPLGQVGLSLRTRHLVMGSFQRDRDQLRVNVQLVRASDGVQLWGQSYDNRGGALEIQSDVALRVATAILARLLPAEAAMLQVRQTRNPVAWDHYQRGNHYLARRIPARVLDSAIMNYEAALTADSTLIQARARIPYAMALVRFVGAAVRGNRGDSLVAIALAAAEDAIRRDSSSSDAWMAKAYLLSFRNQRSYDGVREAFERSVRLDPRNAEALHQYAGILADLRYDDEALRMYRRVTELEPGRAITYRDIAWLHYRRGDVAAAKLYSDSALTIDGTVHNTHYRIQVAAGDMVQARRLQRTAGPVEARFIDALVMARAGDTVAAASLLGNGAPIWLHARTGSIDTVLRRLDQFNTIRDWGHYFTQDYDRPRRDPRFIAAWRAIRPAIANPAVREQP